MFGISAHAINGRTTYQAKIVKPDGYPLEASSVNFRFTILDPAASCILYVEDYAAVNMSGGGGLISFTLGAGARSFPVSGTSSTFSNVFDNTVAFHNCQPTGTYNPSSTDNRKIVMQFQDSSGWQTLPAMTINAVPYAMYAGKSENATQLNGKADTAFVENATLAALNCNPATHAITFNGVSFSCIPVNSGSSGITSVTTSGTVLSTGGTASAPVISIQAATVSQDGYLTSLDYAEFKAKLSASSTQIVNTLGYAPVSGAAVTTQINNSNLSGDVSGTVSANSVVSVGGKSANQISTSVDDTLAATSSATADTIVKRNSSGNFTANDIYATAAKINYVDIYKPSTSFNIRLQAPTSLSTNYVLNLPTTSGTTGQVLSTDGSGNLSWISPTTGSVVSVSAAAPLASTGGSNPTISITQSSSSTDGYLSSTDFNTFNNKQTATSAAIIATLGYTPADNAASGTYAQKANNLSDLASVATARTNLGLGTFATASSIDLGSASATGIIAEARLQTQSNVTSGAQYTKVTVDGKGRVTSGALLSSSDVTTALGYTPSNSASGVTSLNGSVSQTQTFATANTGTDFGITTTNGVHTFSIPLAASSSVVGGLLSNTDYTTFNNKQTATSAAIIATLGYTPANATSATQWTTSGTAISYDYLNSSVGIGTSAPVTTLQIVGTRGVNWSGNSTYRGGGKQHFYDIYGDQYGNGSFYTYGVPDITGGGYWIAAGRSGAYIKGGNGLGLSGGGAGVVAIGGDADASGSASTWGGAGLYVMGGLNGGGLTRTYAAYFDGGDVIVNQGNVGIGTTTPTAKLELASGTASVAPLKFTSGTLLSSAQSGTMEYDGFNFYLTDSTNARRTIATGSSTGSIDNASTINSTGNISMVPVGSVIVSSTTASTNSNTGALVVKGGLGVTGNINTAGNLNVSGSSVIDGSLKLSTMTSGSVLLAGANGVVTQDNSALYWDGANKRLGIGTNAPLSKLDVWGASDQLTLNTTTHNGGNATLRFGLSTSGDQKKVGIISSAEGLWGRASLNFALNSANDLTNVSTSDIKMTIKDSGNVGIGTMTPGYRLSVVGAGHFAPNSATTDNFGVYSNPDTATTGTNIGFWSNALNSSGNRVVHLMTGNISPPAGGYGIYQGDGNSNYFSGNVGIGTSSPTQKLDVSGNANISGILTVGGGNTPAAQRKFSFTVTAGNIKPLLKVRSVPEGAISQLIQIQSKTGANSGTKLYSFQGGFSQLTASWYKMQPLSTGRGHGESTAGFDLYVRLGVDGYEYEFGVASNTTNKLLVTSFTDLTAGDSTMTDISVAAEVAASSAGDVYSLRAMNIEGNVGIGTIAPAYKLTVVGGDIALDRTSKLQFAGPVAGDSNRAYIAGNPNNDLIFGTGGAIEAMRILYTGNVGIGTTNPQSLLQISRTAGSNGNLILDGNSSSTGKPRLFIVDTNGGSVSTSPAYQIYNTNDLFSIGRSSNINTGPADIFNINNSGNVGIGTVAPSENLDVAGNIKTSGLFMGRIQAADTRAVASTPETQNSSGVNFDFKQNTTNGLSDGGIYNGVMSFRPYGTGTDWSGGPAHELGFTTSGSLWMRSGLNTTWGAWKKLATTTGSGSALDGNGTANYVPKYSDADTLTNSIIYDNGTNVGIGTSSPSQQLTTTGNVLVGSGGYPALFIRDQSWWMGTLQSTNTSWPDSDSFVFSTPTGRPFVFQSGAASHTEGTPRMYIDTNNGNVGIGTTSPLVKLHVNEEIAAIGSSYPSMFVMNTSKADGTYGKTWGWMNYGSGFHLNGYAATNSAVAPGGPITAISVQDTTGNVGIGTTAPSNALHVAGAAAGLANIRSSGPSGDNNWAGGIEFTSHNGTTVTSKINASTNGLFFEYGGTERMRINATGNVGVGTTAPVEKLDVLGNMRIGSSDSNFIAFRGTTGDGAGSYNHTYIGERFYAAGESSELLLFKGNDSDNASGPDRIRLAGGNILFDTYATPDAPSGTFEAVATSPMITTKMIIKGNGDVGVGTTSPSYTLDVNGTLRVTGQAYTNTGNGSFSILSDVRYKDVHGNFDRGLDAVLNIDIIKFNYKKDNPLGSDSSHEYVGVSAQNLQQVIPEAVEPRKVGKEEYLTINTSPVLWTLINAVKQLYKQVMERFEDQDRQIAAIVESKADKAEIEVLKQKAAKVDKLEAENVELKNKAKEFDALKSYLCSKDPAAPICK